LKQFWKIVQKKKMKLKTAKLKICHVYTMPQAETEAPQLAKPTLKTETNRIRCRQL